MVCGLREQWTFGTNGNNFRAIIATDGNVGIGTTDPKEKVHIWGAGTQVLAIQGDSGTGPKFTIRGGGTLTFSNDTTPYMNLNASGRFTLNTYGSGTHTGTAAYKLSVTSGGIVIETPIGAGAVDGSGTANYISKWTDDDTIGNSTVYNSGSFVGIATASTISSSAELLAVYSASTGHASFRNASDTYGTMYVRNLSTTASTYQPYIILANGGNRGGLGLEYSTSRLKVHGQGGISFWTGASFGGGTEKVIIASDGKVGIGTTTPDHKLQVKGDISIDNESSSVPSMLHFNASTKANLDPTSRICFWEGDGHAGTYTDSHAFIEYNGSTASGGDGYLALGGYTDAGANQDIMVLNRLGKVGIGTLAPLEKLTLNGGTKGAGYIRGGTEICHNVYLQPEDGNLQVDIVADEGTMYTTLGVT